MTFELFRDEIFAKAKAKGFVDYELNYSAGESFSVRVLNGSIEEYKSAGSEGVGFRGTFEGKMGYASTEKLDVNLIDQLLNNAAANATIIEDKDVEKLYPGDEKYPECDNYDPTLNSVTADEKIKLALDMEKYALSLDPRVKLADYCVVSTSEGSTAIANSYGLNLHSKWNMGSAFLVARVEEKGIMKSGYEFWSGRNFKNFDYKELAKKAVDIAISYIGAAPLESGEYKILFDNSTARDVFSVFSGIFIAEAGQKGFSILDKNKIGETIAANGVTIRDDGIAELSLQNMAFDAEGVATKQKAVIENGVLKTLLYNTKAAAKDGVKSTGNASKNGIGGAITTSTNNFYMVPGTKSYEEMIKTLDTGIIITELAGLHSGANPVSGDFSMSADGYYVENGKIVKPIEQITVAGNFFQLLQGITDIGSDIRFQGFLGMPSFIVDKLNISGL